MFKRIICVVLCFGILALLPLSAGAISEEEITAPAGILMEASTGKILFEKNSHEQRACASITKVMTLLLAMEAIENGVLKYDDMLTASAHAASMGGSDIWLEEGEQMSVDDLIKATAVASANDAAVVLAETIAGSEDSFVEQMNSRAKELGMKDTVFKNCNGLDEDGHLTSAYDVAVMSKELIKHEKIFDYTSIWLDYLRDGETQIVNTNKLLKTYTGITGLKTGTTDDAGCCMSATATRDGITVIAVVLGCDTGTSRFADCATLMDYGFANYKTQKLTLPEESLNSVQVKDGMIGQVEVECQEPGTVVLTKKENGEVQAKYTYKEDITAPITKGDVLGEVTYYMGDEEVKKIQITAKTNVEKITFSSVFNSVLNTLISL